jgi:outer membrane protein TolC
MRYFLFIFLLCSQVLVAQNPKKGNRADTIRVMDIRERLIQLAMQNPTYEIAGHTVTAASYQIRIAKSAYLGLFAASGNINEYTITGAPTYNGSPVPS